MYVGRILADKPYALWSVDTNSPYTDVGGGSRLGEGLTPGSYQSANTLVAGGGSALVAATNNKSRFYFPAFVPGREDKPFSLEVWFAPRVDSDDVAILSHEAIFDGLWWDGTSVHFTTRYDDSECDTSFPLSEIEAVHLVGVHDYSQNSLYVNGVLVSSVDVTDEQVAFDTTTNQNYLYSGYSDATAKIVIDSPAVYGYALSAAQIANHFKYGRAVSLTADVVAQNGGVWFDFNDDRADIYLKQSWLTTDDWLAAEGEDVVVGGGILKPALDEDDAVKEGWWLTSVNLSSLEDETIDAVKVVCLGAGDYTVETSIDDGDTFQPLVAGELVDGIDAGFEVTGKSVEIKISFPEDGDADTAISSLYFASYRTGTLRGSNVGRPTSFDGEVVLANGSNEPIEQNDSRGAHLYGGSISVGVDASEDTPTTGAIEMWVKFDTLGAAATLLDARATGETSKPYVRWTGTQMSQQGFSNTYVNGQPETLSSYSFAVGVWYHLVLVLTTPANDDYVLGKKYTDDEFMDVQIGSFAVYPITLSSGSVLGIFNGYFGITSAVITDASIIEVTESSPAYLLYSHDWSITGAGG